MTDDVRTRNTDSRADTFQLLSSISDHSPSGWVQMSNRDIQEWLSRTHNVDITLPAISARLRSLETLGCIEIQYSARHGRITREILPVKSPQRPLRHRKRQGAA